MNNSQLATTHTSLDLSKKLKEGGCELESGATWREDEFGRYKLKDNSSWSYDDEPETFKDYPAYDLLNDLCVRYVKEMFGDGCHGGVCEGCRGEPHWLSECCDGSRGCPCRGRPYLPGSCDMCNATGQANNITGEIMNLLQQNKKQKAEDYLFENCKFNPKNK